jgi:hypothetical protein
VKLAVSVAVLLLLPSAAFAQGNAGPFGGLFGRTPERVGRDYTVFDIRSSSGLQLDQQLRGSVAANNDINAIAGFTGAGLFEHKTSRLETRLRSSASYHQFLQTQGVGSTTVGSGAQVTWKVATRFAVDASAAYTYSPFFQFFPNWLAAPSAPGVVAPSVPYVTGQIASDTVEATTGFTSYYSKHSTLSATVSHRQTNYRHQAAADFEGNGAAITWTRRTGRHVGVRLGYARETSRSEALGSSRYLSESIEAGIDFERPLSLSRNTTVDFDVESTFIGRTGDTRQFRLNGGISLAHILSRTWHLSLSATRNTEFMAEFSEPLFSDMGGASLTGLVNPRTELLLSANIGLGNFGFNRDQGRFRTANALAQLNVALTQKFGLFAQYGLFHYEYPPGVTTIPTAYRLSRQSLTFGATAWLPIINRERSPSDSR